MIRNRFSIDPLFSKCKRLGGQIYANRWGQFVASLGPGRTLSQPCFLPQKCDYKAVNSSRLSRYSTLRLPQGKTGRPRSSMPLHRKRRPIAAQSDITGQVVVQVQLDAWYHRRYADCRRRTVDSVICGGVRGESIHVSNGIGKLHPPVEDPFTVEFIRS